MQQKGGDTKKGKSIGALISRTGLRYMSIVLDEESQLLPTQSVDVEGSHLLIESAHIGPAFLLPTSRVEYLIHLVLLTLPFC